MKVETRRKEDDSPQPDEKAGQDGKESSNEPKCLVSVDMDGRVWQPS